MSAKPIEERAGATEAAGDSGADGTRIELCGSLRVVIGGLPVTARLPGRQGRALFAFLVVNRHRPVHRQELLDVLWPGDLPEAPEAGLSTIIARVRRAVGHGLIDGRAELRLRLPENTEIDLERVARGAEEAERALARDDPQAAIAAAETALEIIERPLLPGMQGSWVEARREELAALEPDLLEALARAALAAGGREQLATAERAARTLAERHLFRESGYALLIEVHARRGNIAEATLAYDRVRVLLRDELGTAPSAALTALHDELLRSGRIGGAGPPPAAAPPTETEAEAEPEPASGEVALPVIGGSIAGSSFVGRDGHLDRLRSPWLQAGTGEHRLALLVGDPGVGKTRLAAQFAAEVHAAGATVLYGRCDEEPLLSYQPFIGALRHYLRHGDWSADPDAQSDLQELARLIPEARPEAAPADLTAQDPETERYRLFEAVARLIGRATRRRPLLFVLDDLHWADKPTLLALRHLLRHEDPARLLVLGIVRDVEVGADHPLVELIADLRRERRFDRLALEGLDESETDALVSARLEAAPSAGFVRGLRAKTEGNPFFIEEALRSLVEAQPMQPGAQVSERALESIGVPESVADLIQRRLARVSDGAAEALTVAAVVGREFDLGVLQALLQTPDDRLIEALEEAIDSGLIVEVADAGDRFAFSHALGRDAIYGRLSRARRVRLHLAVGDALHARGPSATGAGEIAHHFFLARDIGAAPKAVRYAVLAGEEAARTLAYEESAEHYRRALQAFACQPEADENERCEVLLALGRVQWRAGDAAARETYFEAAASARQRGAADQLAFAALGLGERYWEANAVDPRYPRLLAEALQVLPAQDGDLRARLIGRRAESLHFTADENYGERLSLEGLQMARRLDHVETLLTALMSRHVTLLHIEHLDERVALIDEVLALAGQHRALQAEAHHWRLIDLLELGEVETARRDHAVLASLATQLHQPLLQCLAVGWQGVFAHIDGDVEKAERVARESFELARRAQVRHAQSSLASMVFTLRRQQGRIAELLPTMESLIGGRSASPTWSAALALGRVEAGDVEAGRRRYEAIAARDCAAVPRDWYWFMTMALLAETCAALGDGDRAPRLYELLAPFADRYVQVIYTACWGSAHRHLGLLAGVSERFDVAEEHFGAALDADERIGAVLMTAETQCAYGELLARRDASGDRERAAQLAALAEQVAAERDLEGLRRRARALVEDR